MTHLLISLTLFLTTVLFFIVTLMLIYHWRRYGFKNWVIRLAEMIYLTGGVVLLGLVVYFYTQIAI